LIERPTRAFLARRGEGALSAGQKGEESSPTVMKKSNAGDTAVNEKKGIHRRAGSKERRKISVNHQPVTVPEKGGDVEKQRKRGGEKSQEGFCWRTRNPAGRESRAPSLPSNREGREKRSREGGGKEIHAYFSQNFDRKGSKCSTPSEEERKQEPPRVGNERNQPTKNEGKGERDNG